MASFIPDTSNAPAGVAATPSGGNIYNTSPNSTLQTNATDTAGNNVAIGNTALNPQFNYNTPTPSVPSSITSSNLGSQNPVNVGTPPASTQGNYTAQSQTTIDALNKQISDLKASQTSQPNDLQGYLDKYLGSSTPPPSGTDQYNSLYNSSGIDAKQQAYTKSQNELDALNAQIAGLNYNKDTVLPNKLINDVQTGQNDIFNEKATNVVQQRQNMLQLAPLQFQALLKQAEVTGNANILNAAQSHLDKMFQIQSQDATNQYNYQKDLRDKVYQFATDQEKAKLDAQQKAADQAHQDQQDALKNAQAVAKSAMDNGQSDIAAKISALDPKSPTYAQDVAALQAQVKINPKNDSSIQDIGGRKVQIVTDQSGKIISKTDLGASTSATSKPTAAEQDTTNTTNNIIDGQTKLSEVPTTDANYQNIVAQLSQHGFYSDTPPAWYVQAQNAQFGGNVLPSVIQAKWVLYRKTALGI